MNPIDKKYSEILLDIQVNGYEYEDPNRKGINRREKSNVILTHKVTEGFPIVSLRKTFFKGAVGELLLFLKGKNDIRKYWDYGINFWDQDWARFNNHNEDTVHNLKHVYMSEGSNNKDLAKWYSMGQIYPKQYEKQYHAFDNFKNNPLRTDLIVDSWQVQDLKKMALVPCFTEGTLVATDTGYEPIEKIQNGDTVLTKEGKYKKVYDTMITEYEGTLIGLDVRGNTEIIECTPNHEFFIKDRGWVQSLFINEGDYVGIPRNRECNIPVFSYIKKCNATKEEIITHTLDNKDVWWMMGYFVGDGWVSTGKNEICFSVAESEKDIIIPILRRIFKTVTKGEKSGKSHKYKTTSKKYAEILRLFGHKAINKKIPKFVMEAPFELVEEFLKGYYMADGCKTKSKLNWGTVSKNLAFGIQLLSSKVGKVVTVNTTTKPTYYTIESRNVRQESKYYQINEISDTYNIVVEDEFVWYKIMNKYQYKDIKCKVYNFSVEDSHTYTVYNYATHNCHFGFQILGSPNGFEIVWFQRSTDFMLGSPINIQYYFLMGMLLEEWSGHKFIGVKGILNKCHLYSNQFDLADKMITFSCTDVEYNLPTVKINVKEDFKNLSFGEFIKNIEPEDFTIENYKYHLNDRVEMLTYK